MAQDEGGWWRQHGWTVAILLTAFSLAFLVRTIFTIGVFAQFGWLNIYAGGSDSFYHARVMTFIIENHINLVRDMALRYPNGAINPREPLFDWMNAILGILFQGFFTSVNGQPPAVVAGAFFLDLQAPLWAALCVFPVYLIGKALSGRRVGLLAAIIFPFIVASIDSSAFGYANYLTFYSFFMLIAIYAYIRTAQAVGHRRWVTDYRHPRQIPSALMKFLRTEQSAVKWAVFTGVCLGALALAWQGYSFFIAAIVIFLVIQMIIERIRKVDSFGIYVCTGIVGSVGFPMAMPYYYFQGLFAGWFDTPLLILFGALLVLAPFLALRDYPWVFSVPVLASLGAAAVAVLYFISPTQFATIISGQGYFVKTLIYSTVAEAQAPSIDALILGYGIITFFLTFVGLAVFTARTVRRRFRRDMVFFIVFAVISIYLPITAAKFFLLGSAAFALLPAELLIFILDAGGYGNLRRSVASLGGARGQVTAFRRSFKVRHVLVMGLVLLLIVPNIWYAIDAGIPYNSKGQYATQIYNTIPAPLQPSTAPTGSNPIYIGAAGTSLDTPNQYDEAGYNWLATQDTNEPLTERPALISWWDYGFQTIAEGQHPAVADNFQNGIDPSGNFLLSQNESQAIAILATELIANQQTVSGQPYLPVSLDNLLTADGVNVTIVHNLMVNTTRDVGIVIANPQLYLPVDPGNLDPVNAMYDTMAYYLATTLPLSSVAHLYDDVEQYTGESIRYAMVDSRLFPFSGSSTGIFYAPADLTDRVIVNGVPTSYFTIEVTGSDGNTYANGILPPGVSPVNYNIAYFPAFYNSMIYRTYIGYNGTDVGESPGIPGLDANTSTLPIMPAFMLQHFMVVYRTAYYCPENNPGANSGCPYAENEPTAVALAKQANTTPDTSSGSYFNGGESILEYYAGQPLIGNVVLPDGTAVTGARVTVYDQWNIPHMTTTTSSTGNFQLVLPPGNDTVNVTTGAFSGLTQSDTTHLSTLHIYVSPTEAQLPNAPAIVQTVTLQPAKVSGFVYWNSNNSTTYTPVDSVVPGASINLWSSTGGVFHTTTDASGTFALPNVPAGVYNYSIVSNGANFTETAITLSPGQMANETEGLTPGSVTGSLLTVNQAPVPGGTVTVTGTNGIVAIVTADSTGAYSLTNLGPGNYTLTAHDPTGHLASVGTPVSVASAGSKEKVNLTLTAVVTVSLPVLLNGNPIGGIPVEFTPILPPVPPPTSQNRTNPVVKLNGTTILSSSSGAVVATLPLGNYSVYALGLVGSTYYAGLATALVGSSTGTFFLPSLALAPAEALRGITLPPTGATGTPPTQIEIQGFDASGAFAVAQDNISSDWLLELPAGEYQIYASLVPTSAGISVYAGSASVDLQGAQTLVLPLGPAITFQATVGTAASLGSPFPASGALVSITAQGAWTLPVRTWTETNGNVTFYLPAALPNDASYCLNVTATGFSPFNECDLSPSELQSLTAVPLSLQPVPTTVTVFGVPSGETIHVNATGSAPPAVSTSATGGPNFTLELTPGSYSISAYATTSNGSQLYSASASLNLTIAFGGAPTSLFLSLFPRLESTGGLQLPPGVSAANTSIRLTSSTLGLNVSGAAFVTHFLGVAGTYTAYALASGNNASYVSLSTVTLQSNGTVVPYLSLRSLGTTLRGNLTTLAGTRVNASFPVTLVGPAGLTIPAFQYGGSFTAIVPPNETWTPQVNTTVSATGPGGVPEIVTYAVAPGVTCPVGFGFSSCVIRLSGTVDLSTVIGTIHWGRSPGAPSGHVTWIGPYPASTSTVLPESNGTFRGTLLPGEYTVYAVIGAGGIDATNVSNVTVPYGVAVPISVNVTDSWTDSLTILSGGGATSATVNVTWSGPDGVQLAGGAAPVGSTTSWPLPPGVWTVSAEGTASPYGVSTSAAATAQVTLLDGNAATALTLLPSVNHPVTLTLSGSSAASVAPGSVVRYEVTATDTGNEPVSIHLVGTPSDWDITFIPGNLTLGVGTLNRSASAEAVFTVPVGTAVAHPPVLIQAIDSSGTAVSVESLAPILTVLPVYGVRIGATPNLNTIGGSDALLSFWVQDTGNVPELIALSVLDANRLNGLGWSTEVKQATTVITAPVQFAPNENTSFFLSLAAPQTPVLPPGSGTIIATVFNDSAKLSTETTLIVPSLAVSVQNSTVYVTGPSIGSPSPYPTYLPYVLVVVPAAAFLIGALIFRWQKTRRWTRR
ncbi:MAG: hypothetical protein L3K03_03565 [Thermoplasmata archaeon]|nr:hypothetical protein [Thermoplasmata archaeon]